MINITLNDGKVLKFDNPPTGLDIANSIGKSLSKAAWALKINDKFFDLKHIISEDAKVEIITDNDAAVLDIIRHDMAHILAHAIKELYPKTQITIGPNIENGFYYDVLPEKPFSIDDLELIERRMAEIIDRKLDFERIVWSKKDAIKYFSNIGEDFKVEIINDLPENEIITVYRQGDFIDLCRGPHGCNTDKLPKSFKLLNVAGAYWRGDSNKPMLQRIYGTAFMNNKELELYLYQLSEAKARDHRKLGKEMGLFHIQEEATGAIFWHQKGWHLYRKIQNYMRRRLENNGYFEVNTPTLVDRTLWEKSGHWEKYAENMFISESEKRIYAIKPMNCPCHVQIFKQGIKSYRDLPLRMAEFGSCFRNESSGSLHGLMRVRAFTQDDAHIFCSEDQINSETVSFCNLLKDVYKDFGYEEIIVKFSTRPEKRAGSDDVWDKAEKSLAEAAALAGLEIELNEGEGAFYGPKLEFTLKDALGRLWQVGTLQVDFVLPERLDASYVGEDGVKHRPVMLHRAILGSFERFIGILLEHYGGKLPLWLAPTQVVICSVVTDVDSYAEELKNNMKKANLSVETDLRNEKISYKIREHSLTKIPVIAIIGRKELENKTVTLRFLGEETQITLSASEAIALLSDKTKAPF